MLPRESRTAMPAKPAIFMAMRMSMSRSLTKLGVSVCMKSPCMDDGAAGVVVDVVDGVVNCMAPCAPIAVHTLLDGVNISLRVNSV